MNRRRFLRVGAVGALATAAGCLTAAFDTNRGRVVEKTVRAGETRLVTAKSNGVSATDNYRGDTSVGNVSVNSTEYDRLSKSYGELTYEVVVHQYRTAWPNDAEEGKRTRYTTYRDLFNQLGVGDYITFQPKPTDTSSISSVSCIAPDRESLSARCPTGDDESNGDGGGNGNGNSDGDSDDGNTSDYSSASSERSVSKL